VESSIKNKKDTTLVSVIIPVYNIEPYIERCLLSVLNQSYDNIEILIIDDCGQDKSINLVEQVLSTHPNGSKAKIFYHTQNRGLSAARNTGINNSTGDYLYFLDSDDEITLDCVEHLVSFVDKYPDIELIQGNMRTIPTPAKKQDWRNILYRGFPEYVEDNNWIRQHFYCIRLHKSIPLNACGKLIKRDFIFQHNLFFREGIIHEDELWMFFVVKKLKNIAFSIHFSYIAYKRQGSIMQSDNNYESIRSWYIILEEIFTNFDDLCYKNQKKKYINMLFRNMKHINFDLKESEFYFSYKLLVKALLKKNIRQNIFFTSALTILLTPPYFYKSIVGYVLFYLCLELA
jgi:glycosyltransferase involved in cell wall biosynthesis